MNCTGSPFGFGCKQTAVVDIQNKKYCRICASYVQVMLQIIGGKTK